MPTAYSLIPPERPATQEELVKLYQPVIGWWVSRAWPNPLRTHNDIQQDAYLGLLHAWHSWKPGKGMSFKPWVVKIIGQWVMFKGLFYFGLNLHLAYYQDNLEERMAVIAPLSLDKFSEDWGDYYEGLVDPQAEAEFDKLFALSLDDLVGLVKDKRNRLILRWVYLEGRTYDDIGLELGISKQAVQQRLKKAYGQIRKRLANAI